MQIRVLLTIPRARAIVENIMIISGKYYDNNLTQAPKAHPQTIPARFCSEMIQPA